MSVEFDSKILGVIPVFVIADIVDEKEPDLGIHSRWVEDMAIYYDGKLLDNEELSVYDVDKLEIEALTHE